MNMVDHVVLPNVSVLPNGSGAAAILSAGIGSFALAVLAFAGDKSTLVRNSLVFYKPTGPLSGVTSVAILIWLVIWGLLEYRWKKQNISLSRVNVATFVLLSLSFLLTFPPIADLL